MNKQEINEDLVKRQEALLGMTAEGFETVSNQNADMGFKSYKSEDAKAREEFKYYNTTNLYVTFRKTFVKQIETKGAAKNLFYDVVLDELKKEEHKEELDKYHVDVSQIKLKTSFSQHIVATVSLQTDFKFIAKILSKRPEVLAIEWLNKKILFGIKADLNEMSGFKSKIKKLVLDDKQKPADTVVFDAEKDVFEKNEVIDLDQMSAEQQAEVLKKASAGVNVKTVGGK